MNESSAEFFLPDLFYIESTNILWKYARAKMYPVEDIVQDLANLKSLSLRVVSTAELMELAFQIAHELRSCTNF